MKHRAFLFGCLAAAITAASATADDRDRDDHSPHRDADQACRRDLPGKRLVRPLFRHLSQGPQPVRRDKFTASKHTPKVNNLANPLDVNNIFGPLAGIDLLNNNPNSNPNAPAAPIAKTNGAGASNPFRLSPSQALTADQGHNESPEESAYDNGQDGWLSGLRRNRGAPPSPPAGIGSKALVMGYYDGNTVTALWNYAQHFALNDNNYTTQFGPSTPGAINLISGQTNGVAAR